MLCEYGCGQEGKHTLKNGKRCCSESQNSCPVIKKRTGDPKRGRTKENNEGRKKQAEKLIGRTKENHEGRRIQAEKITGRTKETHEECRIQSEYMKNGGASYTASFVTKESRKRQSKRMKDWQAVYMCSCISDDSKPENELFYMTCTLLPRPIHKFPIYRGKGKRNYVVDIADSSLGIILEFDGWYHFYKEDRKEYDKRRQQEIEEEGWKFLRYNIFQKFPTLDQVKEDIKKLLEDKENVCGMDQTKGEN